MFTKPDDMDDRELLTVVSEQWHLGIDELAYAPLGFGSHHWVASGGGERWFVTVDDLTSCLIGEKDTHDAAFARLESAFRSAQLLADGGLDFVVPPLPSESGEVLHRFRDRYSVLVHPFIDGESPDDGKGAYSTPEHRDAVVALLPSLHAATPLVDGVATRDDLSIPQRDRLEDALGALGTPWETGPFAERARKLLDEHAVDVVRLLPAYDRLATRVAEEPDRYVITHGEPGAQNVMFSEGRYLLIDWESARIAAPERDLFDLSVDARSVLDAYAEKAGVEVRDNAIDAYRLYYDFFEIAGYIEFFRQPHRDTTDAAVSWENLVHYLRPRERWPQLL